MESRSGDADAHQLSMDLMTVVLHELGHQLGLDDEHGEESAESLMYWQLQPGQTKRMSVSQTPTKDGNSTLAQINDQSLLSYITDLDEISFLSTASDNRRRSSRGNR